MDKLIEENYKELANAIILMAVKDYRKALKRLKRYPDSDKALRTKRECERFFRSEYFEILTNLNGRELEQKLKAI